MYSSRPPSRGEHRVQFKVRFPFVFSLSVRFALALITTLRLCVTFPSATTASTTRQHSHIRTCSNCAPQPLTRSHPCRFKECQKAQVAPLTPTTLTRSISDTTQRWLTSQRGWTSV
ncbi:hypothetical protein F5888DRAFT_1660799 [Russula emetica]|nr:hypothetical protein F5888DRAFT_1660799 [Russula emetica]